MENLREINCKDIFQKAYENRYTWKNEFIGYKGKCIFFVDNKIHKGEICTLPMYDLKNEIVRGLKIDIPTGPSPWSGIKK